jgi:aryl-alcohol dehydrogenase-like predicted oxidoreductase
LEPHLTLPARPLGRDGPVVPALFVGTWPIGGGMGAVARPTALATLRRAIDLGITAFDTAEGYGNAEELLGEAVAPSERPALFLATKVSFGPYTAARVRAAAEQSVRRLRTDYLDLLQLHFFPADISLEAAMEALWAVQDAGLTRWVGVSNFTAEQLDRASERRRPQALQTPLNLFDRDELVGSIRLGREIGAGVLCHSALAKGLLTGSLARTSTFATDDERSRHPRFGADVLPRYLEAADALSRLAAEVGVSLVELAVAWVLAQPGVTATIAGPRAPDELDAQARGARVRLSSEIVAEASRIAAQAPAIGHGTPTTSPRPPV